MVIIKKGFFFTNQKKLRLSSQVDETVELEKNIGEAAVLSECLVMVNVLPPDCLGHAGENALTHRHVGHTAAT